MGGSFFHLASLCSQCFWKYMSIIITMAFSNGQINLISWTRGSLSSYKWSMYSDLTFKTRGDWPHTDMGKCFLWGAESSVNSLHPALVLYDTREIRAQSVLGKSQSVQLNRQAIFSSLKIFSWLCMFYFYVLVTSCFLLTHLLFISVKLVHSWDSLDNIKEKKVRWVYVSRINWILF